MFRMYHKFVWEKGIQGGFFIKLIKTLKINIMETLEVGGSSPSASTIFIHLKTQNNENVQCLFYNWEN